LIACNRYWPADIDYPVFCVLFSVLFFLSSVFCYAGTPHEEYRQIQKEIKKQKRKLEAVKKRESSVLTEIELTNKQMKTVERMLHKYKKRLMNTESQIAEVEYDISQNKSNIEKHMEWMKRKIREMNKYGHNWDLVMLLLSSDDVSQLMRTGKYLQYITIYENKLLKSYKDSLEDLNKKEKQLIALKGELISNREQIKAEELSLAEKKNKKMMLLASVKKEKNSYSKMLKEMQDVSRRILEIIKESEKTEKENVSFGKSFSSLKGRLPWPVNGKIVLPYGSQRDPQFNTPIFRSGAYIRSNDSSFVRAVHRGRVVYAEWFKGYGELVIVNHGDGYHTLYGSLSEIFTKVGDIIKDNQPVGRVGTSGLLNSPGLYFEVRYKGKPLDPLQWLKRR
jgi:septal ring factor EnvC (AmiA/AmiB activator)